MRTVVIRMGRRDYTNEEWVRREWIMRPIVIRQYGGKSFAGFYNHAEEAKDAVYRRHLRWMARQQQTSESEELQYGGHLNRW